MQSAEELDYLLNKINGLVVESLDSTTSNHEIRISFRKGLYIELVINTSYKTLLVYTGIYQSNKGLVHNGPYNTVEDIYKLLLSKLK